MFCNLGEHYETPCGYQTTQCHFPNSSLHSHGLDTATCNFLSSSIYCKSTIYFVDTCPYSNLYMIYLLTFNITYIIIFATCFDSHESSSGINFKNYCTYCFTVFMSYSFCRAIAIGIPFCVTNQSQCLYGIREGCGW